MEDMENMKSSVEANSTGASMKASTKAFMEVMDSFTKFEEASMEVTVTSIKY